MTRTLPPLLVAALAMLLATPALANPIACELEGGFSSDGNDVQAWFLGQCGSAADYESQQVVQWLDGGEWLTVDGSWVEDGTELAEGGSGEMDYTVFKQTSPCPDGGEIEIRIAYLYDEFANGWTQASVMCDGDDDDDDAADDDDDAADDDDDHADDDDDDDHADDDDDDAADDDDDDDAADDDDDDDDDDDAAGDDDDSVSADDDDDDDGGGLNCSAVGAGAPALLAALLFGVAIITRRQN